ncbi:alcohol dehydrogenase [Vibrio ishigakensis]|uniref:Alcohol dehydrogenase n=1 Tax=Vibrio ishigakensis TaxID=1481914 RepID=A0A0B8Q776_9VIBR|nr:alcohol dehydrogenase [Vibrio ishigakensis]
MATTNFSFNLKTIIHAHENGIQDIPALFDRIGAKKVVLFTDKGLESLGFVEKFGEVFAAQSQVEIAGVYTDIEADASCDNINAAIEFTRKVGADGILSIGGGSVIDASKGVKYAMHKALATSVKSSLVAVIWKFGQTTKISRFLILPCQPPQVQVLKHRLLLCSLTRKRTSRRA